MTSTFASGPTVHGLISTKLNRFVNYKTILSCRASLTATFSPSWETFVLQHGTFWKTKTFGSASGHLGSIFFTGLTDRHLQVWNLRLVYCITLNCSVTYVRMLHIRIRSFFLNVLSADCGISSSSAPGGKIMNDAQCSSWVFEQLPFTSASSNHERN